MFRNLSIKARLVGVIAFLSVQLIVGGIICIVSLGNANESLKTMYDDRVLSLGQLDMVVRMLLHNKAEITEAAMNEASYVEKTVSIVNERVAILDKKWDEYIA